MPNLRKLHAKSQRNVARLGQEQAVEETLVPGTMWAESERYRHFFSENNKSETGFGKWVATAILTTYIVDETPRRTFIYLGPIRGTKTTLDRRVLNYTSLLFMRDDGIVGMMPDSKYVKSSLVAIK